MYISLNFQDWVCSLSHIFVSAQSGAIDGPEENLLRRFLDARWAPLGDGEL